MAHQPPSRAGSDDYELFLSLFTKSQGRLQAFIRTLVHDQSQADDVFQATSLVLWRSFGTFRRDAEFLPWAIGTARHQVLMHWRSRRRDRHVFSEALLADLAETTEAAIETTEARMAALDTCIAALPDRQRELIRLFYGENLAADAIAKRRGHTVHAVYKSLKVMRKALFECVTKKLSSLIDPFGDGCGSRPALS